MQAVILAGGRGSRLGYLTDNTPKPMVEINGKPMISHIIELLKKHGFDDIIITLGYKGEVIRKYFQNGHRFGLSIRYGAEIEPLGTAGCVKNVSSFLDKTFLIISGDAYTNIDLKMVFDYHNRIHSEYTIVGKYVTDCRGFGLIKADTEMNIERFIEKPPYSIAGTVNTGIYIFNRSILDHIDDGFCDFSRDVFPKILNKLKLYKTNEFWSDVGTLDAYYSINKNTPARVYAGV